MTRGINLFKLSKECSHGGGHRNQTQQCLGSDAEGTFRSDEHTEQVVAAPVCFTTELDNLATCEYDFDSEHVVSCRPVL